MLDNVYMVQILISQQPKGLSLYRKRGLKSF